MHRIIALNLPFGAAFLVNKMLADTRCTPDHVLICADAFDEMADALPPTSHFVPSLKENSAKLRSFAPSYVKGPGKPHGDFDGTLTP